jgi:hypothetical protein
LDGLPNTTAIVAADTGTTAAAVCQSAGAGWFLPSVDELEFGVLSNFASIPFIGGDYAADIWTSSEISEGAAMAYDFVTVGGSVNTMDANASGKTSSFRVIAYKKINL